MSPPLIDSFATDFSIPIRIGILDTASTPLPKAHAKYGNWATIIEQHLFSGADALGLSRDHLRISKWDVVNGHGKGLGGIYPRLEDIDVVLITGSRWFAPSLLPLLIYLKNSPPPPTLRAKLCDSDGPFFFAASLLPSPNT